jgi:hypothetical protein
VYKAQIAMVREMTGRLKTFGVPFFGTRSNLVRKSTVENGTSIPESEKEKGMIDEMELVKLQKKMLAMLEDLCND